MILEPSCQQEGRITYLIAEDNENNLFIGFRGTKYQRDWTDVNLKVQQKSDVKAQGKFHSGFLNLASEFPIATVMSNPRLVITSGITGTRNRV